MVARRMGIRVRSTVEAAVAVVLAAAAFAVALTAAAGSQSYGQELSHRLVPAAAGAEDMLGQFTAQQASLRDAVTSGSAAGLASFREAGAEFRGARPGLPRSPAAISR